ncbi:MAG: hypothetical protein C0619_12120, partial [Desulfuromonas sp.]
NQDIYVAKFDSDLTTLEAASYYGTTGWEYGTAAIALHPDGSVYLAGKTQGVDLPGAESGYQTEYTGGMGDAFVARLNEDLSGPPQATYLGGTGEDAAFSVTVNAVDGHDLYGSVYVAGRTNSADFPGTTGGFLETNQGSMDVFVAYFNPTLTTLGQATYYGGTAWDELGVDGRGQSLVINPLNGNVVFVGFTGSSGLPGLWNAKIGGTDAFFVGLSPMLDNDVETGAYIGGYDDDYASAIALLPVSTAGIDYYIVGRTKSTEEFISESLGGFYTTYQGGNFDAFVVRYNINSSPTGGTYLGGLSDDRGYGIAISPIDQRVWVSGETNSTDFPSYPFGQGDNAGYLDAFVSAFSLDLSSLDFSDYLGGSDGDYGAAMAVNEGFRRIYVVGNTGSADIYGTDSQSADNSYNEGGDAFVAWFDELNIDTPESLWQTQDIGPGWEPDISVDDEGNAFVCYFHDDQMHIKKKTMPGIWTTIGSYDRPDGTGFSDCSIAAEGDGLFHVCLVTKPPYAQMSEGGDGNNLWYLGPGMGALQSVDIDEYSDIGVDGACVIALAPGGSPSISYRAVRDWPNNSPIEYSLAVAVKPVPTPELPWIVMDNLDIDYNYDTTLWSPSDYYGSVSALAFDSGGLPVAAFKDEDDSVSFYIPSEYPPTTSTTLPDWTRYPSNLRGSPIRLQWSYSSSFSEYTDEGFDLHLDRAGSIRSYSFSVIKSDSVVTDFTGLDKFKAPEFSSDGLSDSASPYDMISSHDSQARFIRIESDRNKRVSFHVNFGGPYSELLYPHYTEVVGNDLKNCALTINSSSTSQALCENSTGNLVYARQISSAAGFLGVSPLNWEFGEISWTDVNISDTSEWRAFYLTNQGHNRLFIRDIRIESPDPAPWAMELDCDIDFAIDLTSDVILEPGQTTAVCIRPDPAAYSDDRITAQLVVETDQQTVVAELSAGEPASDDDNDGVPDEEEMGPDGTDATYDGNSDGIADSEQANVASLHTHDDANYVTIAAESGLTLEDVTATSNPTSAALPEGLETPYGFFYFVVDGLAAGGSTEVTLTLPDGETADSYWKYGPLPGTPADAWYEFSDDGVTGAQIAGNVITLYLTDGIRGDHDLDENGRIVDPGVPTVTPDPVPSGGGGGGGCFIATAAYG